jgi:hypothetical protein
VDHNLRPLPVDGSLAGDFDRGSIMLYRFPALFYRTNPSPCAPSGNGVDLSPGDVTGILRAYPFDEDAAKALTARRTGVVAALSRLGGPARQGVAVPAVSA